MTIGTQVAMWGVGTLVAIGAIYGDVKARLKSIEAKLGTNGDGVFVRKTELELMKASAEKEHGQLREEDAKLWSAIDGLRQRG